MTIRLASSDGQLVKNDPPPPREYTPEQEALLALLERETLTGDQVKAILAAASKGGHTGQTEATALPV